MKQKVIGTSIMAAVLVLSFQNCSGVNFNPDNAITSLSVDPAGTGDSNPTPTPTSTPLPPNVVDIGTVPTGKCDSFVELQIVDGQALTIPARTKDNICFIAKLIDSKKFSPSNSNPNIENDIYSRNHDITFSDSTVIHHPYFMGGGVVRVILKGERAIKLSGGKNDTSSILVDNFIMIGIAPIAQIGDPQYYKAYGTADSSVNNTDGILFKDRKVVVKAFASGGTSTIKPLDLEGFVEFDREYGLDIRAIDAGATGSVSNIYMVFK